MVERKIGEKFIDDDGILVECIEDDNNIFACCTKEGNFCKYYGSPDCTKYVCTSNCRTDKKNVCFVEVKE